ncbi:DUF1102 domain-containing protein [Sporosarcina jiandibaonis]|uniref:DUF1102 domain-containing protein n=1 Tax=Sporosarcina jiandibaonis TaxID=2715535 RepID=UPI001557C2B4|nr:DUF1102 domain-containing protein [Sporosarcina jiandibaonis]
MKMKKGLLMVVLLLALSSIMAAMSYTSATVTSAMSGTVKSTDASLLALKAGSHKAATIDNDILKIDFNKGNVTSMPVSTYGLQKQSEYVWNGLFSVANNSDNVVNVTIKTENNLPAGVKLYVKTTGGWTEINSINGHTHSGLPVAFKTNAGHEVSVDIKVVVGSNASLGNFAPNLVVSAQ